MPILEVQQRCLQDDVGLFSLHQHVILDRLIARGVSELVCISEIPKSPSCWSSTRSSSTVPPEYPTATSLHQSCNVCV